jgi:heat shock protein HtpX
MKRIVLFLATNLAVMLVMSLVLSLLGVNRYLAGSGLNLGSLMVFSLVVGFTGAIFSLLISKPMAKWSTGARVILASNWRHMAFPMPIRVHSNT